MKLPSRNRLILLTVLLQLAALGFIAGKREWIYNHGEVVTKGGFKGGHGSVLRVERGVCSRAG